MSPSGKSNLSRVFSGTSAWRLRALSLSPEEVMTAGSVSSGKGTGLAKGPGQAGSGLSAWAMRLWAQASENFHRICLCTRKGSYLNTSFKF